MKLALPLCARAPAKVNLCLYVGPARADGLHEICSLIQSISLADDVTIERAHGDTDEVVAPGVHGPNLAAAALAAFRSRFGWDEGPIRIAIEKRIPIAAGLGGGSADAAAMLRLAAAASGIEPQPGELAKIGMSVGADVPSQLAPGLTLTTGAGEEVVPLEPSGELGFLILSDEHGLSTKDVYRRADELGLPHAQLKEMRTALEQAAAQPATLPTLLHNDLQPATLDLAPRVADALDLLGESGASGALVSGSGPSTFGLYENVATAEQAAKSIEKRWAGGMFVASAVEPPFGAPRQSGAVT